MRQLSLWAGYTLELEGLTGHKRVAKIVFALSVIFDIFPFEISSTSAEIRLACNSINSDGLEGLPAALLADGLQKIHFVGILTLDRVGLLEAVRSETKPRERGKKLACHSLCEGTSLRARV